MKGRACRAEAFIQSNLHVSSGAARDFEPHEKDLTLGLITEDHKNPVQPL